MKYLILQDPVSSRVRMEEDEFKRRWFDKEEGGTPYERYGIAAWKAEGLAGVTAMVVKPATEGGVGSNQYGDKPGGKGENRPAGLTAQHYDKTEQTILNSVKEKFGNAEIAFPDKDNRFQDWASVIVKSKSGDTNRPLLIRQHGGDLILDSGAGRKARIVADMPTELVARAVDYVSQDSNWSTHKLPRDEVKFWKERWKEPVVKPELNAVEPAKESKSDAWIADKIKKLRAEGKSQEQAVAIAMQMSREK